MVKQSTGQALPWACSSVRSWYKYLVPFTAECNSSEVQVAVRGVGALSKDHYRSHFPVDVNVWWAVSGVGSFHQCSQTVFSEKPFLKCIVTKKSICSLQSFNHDDIISKTCTPAVVLSESPLATAFISQFRPDGNCIFFCFMQQQTFWWNEVAANPPLVVCGWTLSWKGPVEKVVLVFQFTIFKSHPLGIPILIL